MSEQKDPTTKAEAKWGDALRAGFQVLPDALVRGQRLLGLSPTDVVVIANINQAWWFEDRLPYLQPQTIAKRMGVSERSVQRSLHRLRTKGYLKQVRIEQSDGAVRYLHDLAGLRGHLEQLARRDLKYTAQLRKQDGQPTSDTLSDDTIDLE
jgi:predicted transcriptional regulator